MDWEKFKKQWLEKRENWTDHGGHIAGQETNGVEFRIFKARPLGELPTLSGERAISNFEFQIPNFP